MTDSNRGSLSVPNDEDFSFYRTKTITNHIRRRRADDGAPGPAAKPNSLGDAPHLESRFLIQLLHILEWDAHIHGIPQRVVHAIVLLCWSSVFQLIADIVFEVLQLTGVIPKVEFRLAFTILTLLSFMLAFHDLSNIRNDELDTTVQSLRLSFLVEFGLVLVDLEFVFFPGSDDQMRRVWYRAGFLVFTAWNVFLLCYVMFSLHLFWETFGLEQVAHFFCGMCCEYCEHSASRGGSSRGPTTLRIDPPKADDDEESKTDDIQAIQLESSRS